MSYPTTEKVDRYLTCDFLCPVVWLIGHAVLDMANNSGQLGMKPYLQLRK